MTGLILDKSKPVRIFLAPEDLTEPVLHKYNIFYAVLWDCGLLDIIVSIDKLEK